MSNNIKLIRTVNLNLQKNKEKYPFVLHRGKKKYGNNISNVESNMVIVNYDQLHISWWNIF